jgi:hypothetical protein
LHGRLPWGPCSGRLLAGLLLLLLPLRRLRLLLPLGLLRLRRLLRRLLLPLRLLPLGLLRLLPLRLQRLRQRLRLLLARGECQGYHLGWRRRARTGAASRLPMRLANGQHRHEQCQKPPAAAGNGH